MKFATRGLALIALLAIADTRYTSAGPGAASRLPSRLPSVMASAGPSVGADRTSSIRFNLREGFLIVVDGQIGPLEHLKFILDTGASQTVVSSKVANQLAIPREKSTIFNFDRQVATQSGQIPQVRVGPIVASGMHIMVGDLGQYSEFARDVDAIIGLDVLTRAGAVRIDYDTQVVEFQQRVTIQERQPSVHGAIAVRVQVQGEPVRLLVDTGLEGIVLYESALRERHVKVPEGVPARQGHLSGQRVVLEGVRIGAEESSAPVFVIHNESGMALAGVDGYLGAAALKAKRIEFDFESMTMRWR